jgi:hypothetical protein
MKLYTEEQVRKAIRVAGQLVWEDEEIFASLPSIELPKDEDIDKNIEKLFYGEKKYYFKAGITWMKQHILNQNK